MGQYYVVYREGCQKAFDRFMSLGRYYDLGYQYDVVAGAWQARGHLAADVDPLGIKTANLPELGMRAPRSELIMRKYFNFGTQETWNMLLSTTFGSNHSRIVE